MSDVPKRRGRPPKVVLAVPAPAVEPAVSPVRRRRHAFITASVPFVAARPDVLAGFRKKQRPTRRLTIQPNPV